LALSQEKERKGLLNKQDKIKQSITTTQNDEKLIEEKQLSKINNNKQIAYNKKNKKNKRQQSNQSSNSI